MEALRSLNPNAGVGSHRWTVDALETGALKINAYCNIVQLWGSSGC